VEHVARIMLESLRKAAGEPTTYTPGKPPAPITAIKART
jgi:hypothetical protein